MPSVRSFNFYKNTCLKKSRTKRKRFPILFAACLFFLAPSTAQIQEKESNVKAAFIYNFTKYIEWDTNNGDEFVIGIIGTSPIYQPLSDIAATKTVQNKRIVIRQVNKPEEIANCDILFISANSSFPLSSIFANTHRGTLLISETPGYANMGTALNFIVEHDKLKFEANLKSISDEGLKASSQLLKLATIVN